MAETAAHLVDHVLPVVPIRQWVLSLPYSLRTTLGYEPALLGAVLRVFVRAVSGWIRGKVREKVGRIDARDVHFGAVTLAAPSTTWCRLRRLDATRPPTTSAPSSSSSASGTRST
jgi:hypothetical protein